MKIDDLKTDATINQWLDIVNIRDTTRKSYLLGMQTFTEYTNKDPETLLNEADKEQDANVKARNRAVNKYMYGFRNYLQNKGLAPLSIKNYMTGVKSFYRSFDIEFKQVKQETAIVKQENTRIPTIEDLREIIKTCDIFETAIITCACSSGIDGSTMCNITIGQFKDGYDAKTGITALTLRRQKTSVDFVTCITKEATDAINNYLKWRARTTDSTELKRQKQLAKQKVYSDSNYLFILRKIPDSFLDNYDDEIRKIDRAALMKIYREISTKANKNTEKGKFNFVRSHGCRKFFDSTVLNSGLCDYFHCEEYMGHALPGTQGHYYKIDVEGLKAYYLKFAPLLTIQRPLNVSESIEYQNIKSENDILRAETAKHIVERTELEKVKTELTVLQSEFNNMNQLYTEMYEATPVNVKAAIKKNMRTLIFLPDDGGENLEE